MEKLKNGGPAFAKYMSVSHGGIGEYQYVDQGQEGMSLRDYFAAKAMVSYMEDSDWTESEVAEAAYSMADAMVLARARDEHE